MRPGNVGVTHRLSLVAAVALISHQGVADGYAQRFEDGSISPPNVEAGRGFGHSIAVDAHVAIIGSAGPGLSERGSAVWVFDLERGEHRHEWYAEDGHEGNYFGFAVDIEGETAIVSAIFDDDYRYHGGAAYLFDVTTGRQLRKLQGNPDPKVEELLFGFTVALDDTIAVAGTQGDPALSMTGWVYIFDVESGMPLLRLSGPDRGDSYGQGVAADDGVVAVTAYQARGHGPQQGVVYLHDGFTGEQRAIVTPSDAHDGQRFGGTVTLGHAMLLVSSSPDETTHPGPGRVYVYDVANPSAPIEVAKLVPSEGFVWDEFGTSAAIDDRRIVIGAPWSDHGGPDAGAAYLFDRASFAEIAMLLPSAPADGGNMGRGVALRGSDVLVGVPAFEQRSARIGSVLLFNGDLGSDLIIASPTPGIAGEVNRLRVGNAQPGNRVYLMWSDREGASPVRGCPDLQIDLHRPTILAFDTANAAGVAAFVFDVPAFLAGEAMYAQAVEPRRCVKSRLLAVTWE